VGTPRQTIEHELKLGAEPGFRLPELPGSPLPERRFTSTYHDTPDFRLARAGVTLRRRVEARAGLWQLKLPRGVTRLELELPGGPAGPPAGLRDLLTPYLRGAELAPVAQLRTHRAGVRAELDGAAAEVTVDAVSVLLGRRVERRFRELEVELVEGEDGKALRRLEKTLRAAGATDGDIRPKLLQALDLPAPEPPPRPAAGMPLREYLSAMLLAQVRALVYHDPGTRLGTDPEELHQLRVATRRLRAYLRAAEPFLDVAWAEALRAELGWLGGALGPVRDLDVLLERLRGDAETLEPAERRAFARLLARLEQERESDRGALLEALRSERYLALLDRLDSAAADPRLTTEQGSVADLAAAEFRRLRKAARGLPPDPPDDLLHALRIKGKRARYAAELAEPATGKRASAFIAASKVFQDVLGEHQDAVVAEERVRAALRRLGGRGVAFAAGRIVERERSRRAAARAAFPDAWSRLERAGEQAWR
jgi:CHAD domain-containing protein